MSAASAELRRPGKDVATLGASDRKRGSALLAELCAWTILVLAVRALHWSFYPAGSA